MQQFFNESMELRFRQKYFINYSTAKILNSVSHDEEKRKAILSCPTRSYFFQSTSPCLLLVKNMRKCYFIINEKFKF